MRKTSGVLAGALLALSVALVPVAADAATYPCSPGQTLRSGQYDSPCVKALQTYLNGYQNARLALDGDFGPKTKSAVQTYQRRAGLVDDGIVGPKTRLAILARSGIPVNSGATDAQIRAAGAAWEQMVRGWGFPLD